MKLSFLKFAKSKPINAITPFNKGGNRIVLREAAKFSSIEAPLGTIRAERVLIERAFGDKSTDMRLYYDSEDRLIGQKRMNYDGNTLTDYSESRYTVRKKLHWNKYIFSLGDTQLIRYNPDKSIQSATRHKVDIVKEEGIDQPFINIMQYYTERTSDNTFSENFSISNKENYIKTKSIRTEEGDLLEAKTTASENIPPKVANDEYLTLRGMPDELAIKSLFRIFSKKERLENPDNIDLFFIKGSDINYIQGISFPDRNRIGIATLPILGQNINTTAHEIRHFKQDELKRKLKTQLWNKFFNRKNYNPREFQLALYFLKCKLQECPFPVGFLTENWYRKSGIEKDAFKIGDRFENDFKRRTSKLNRFFPRVTKHNMGEAMLPNR